jgi:acetyltransferase/esterase
VIPYEPPAASICPDFVELVKTHDEVYALYRKQGIHPAIQEFGKLTKTNVAGAGAMMDFSIPFMFSNVQYWFEREFTAVPTADFDVEKDLRPHKDKMMPIHGDESPKDAYQVRAMAVACEKLGLEYVQLPGGHVGHATHCAQFTPKLMEALKAKDQLYANL